MGDLTRISEIQAASNPPKDLEDSPRSTGFVTSQEVIERNLPHSEPIPPPEKCQFCGRVIYPKGAYFMGTVAFWFPPERCDCEEAKRYWEEYDARIRAEQEAEAERKRRIDLEIRIKQCIGQCGIKKRFMQRTFDSFICDTDERVRCFNIARRYVETFEARKAQGDGLYIEGTNGTGKTHLAAAIALELLNKGIPVICKTANNLLLDIKKTFGYGDTTLSESAVLDLYKSADLLIIDDLGKEQCSEWSVSTLYSIINDRYEDMKPIIITTNYNSEGLLEALTPKGSDSTKAAAILSRLKETSFVLTMAWEDYRVGGHK